MIDTLKAMRRPKQLPASVIRGLQDDFNVNLNAAGEGDDYLDAEQPDEVTECMTVLEPEEAWAALFEGQEKPVDEPIEFVTESGVSMMLRQHGR